jgi:hypothetical protein
MRKATVMGLALAFVFALTGVMAGRASADVLVPPPDSDPFYTAPAGYESQPNGAVLRDRQIDAEYLLPFLSTDVLSQLGSAAEQFAPWFAELKNLKIDAYQVLYKTTDGHDQPTTGVETILVPQGPWVGGGTRPLISYQIAEDATTTRCAPSYTIRAGLSGADVLGPGTYEIALSLLGLAEGYAISYSDYEGPQSQWTAGPKSGRGVLDGIRATLNYSPAGLPASTPVGLWGYSGGGGATGWAAYLKASYAPELNVVGAAIGASSNSDLTQLYNRNNGTLTDGLLVDAIVGQMRAYPEAGIDNYLNPAGKLLMATAQDDCLIEGALKHFLNGPMELYTNAPWVPLTQSAPGKFIFRTSSQINYPAPSMPILNYHDYFDELVPVKADNDLAKHYCALGSPVEVMRTSTPTPFVALVHIAGEVEGDIPALNYLTNRFKGLPPRNDCGAAAQWGSPTSVVPYGVNTQ